MPFIFLSNLLISSFFGSAKLGIWLIGYFSGYPVGAQCAFQAYKSHQISKEEAGNMMVCCNNPGPSFIFGITSSLFLQKWAAPMLWAIHIISSLILYSILPTVRKKTTVRGMNERKQHTSALHSMLRTMGIICSCVILFKMAVHMMHRWFLWKVPKEWSAFVVGLLEITNGCLDLTSLSSVGLRFVLCSFYLGMGGVCTMLQTYAVTGGLYFGKYVVCKFMQSGISVLIAYAVQWFFLPEGVKLRLPCTILATVLTVVLLIAFSIRKNEKTSRNFQPVIV